MTSEFDERSADMRLVELQRRRLDLPERPLKWAQDPEALKETFSGAPHVALDAPELSAAMVIASLHVSPSRGLIPGALVTVTLLVENGGGVAAAVRARLSLSLDASYRLGSTTVDERAAPDVDESSAALGERGIDLGSLGPGDRRRLSLTAKVGVATEPFRVTAQLDAGGAPALGVAPLEIERSRSPGAFAQAVAQRMALDEPAQAEPAQAEPAQADAPAYELEPEEALVYEAADAALSAERELKLTPAAPEAEHGAPVWGAPEPVAEPEPVAVTVPEPVAVTVPEPPPQSPVEEPSLSPSYVLWASVDGSAIRFLARVLQDGSTLGLLGHFLVANALVARYPSQGAGAGDALGLAKFSAEQAALLNRLMLQARMKRATSLDAYATPPPLEQISRIERLPLTDGATLPAALPRAQDGSLVLFATLGSA
ncbi:MAG: hypothetical protein KGM44_13205, partial [bacterium]|nr:hypothetical protein [bacterium]